MSRAIPYSLSLWQDITAVYGITVAEESDLKVNQTIYVNDTNNIRIPYPTVYKGKNSDGTYKYAYKKEGQVIEGSTDLAHIFIGKQVFEEEMVEELASDTSTFEGKAFNINLTRNINGMNTLTFSLPRTYFDRREGKNKLNPLPDWIWNRSKIKLKYGTKKVSDWDTGEGSEEVPCWYTFIVNNRAERRDGKKIIYDFTCEDMFINELSKTGYNLRFDEEHDGIGTIDELAPLILASTEWEYKNSEPNEFIEKRDTYEEDANGNIVFDSDGLPISVTEEVPTSISEYNEKLGRTVFRYQYYKKAEGNLQPETEYFIKSINMLATYKKEDSAGAPDNEKIYLFEYTKYKDSSNERTFEIYVSRDDIYNSKSFKYYTVDNNDNEIWGYTTVDTITTGTVRNLIYNGKDYTDSTGWKSTTEDKIDTTSIQTRVTWEEKTEGNPKPATYKLIFTAMQNDAFAYNDTMKTAKTTIKAESTYALKINYSGSSFKAQLRESSYTSNAENVLTGDITVQSEKYIILKPIRTTDYPYLFFHFETEGNKIEVEEVQLFELKAKDGTDTSKNKLENLPEGPLQDESILENYALLPNESSVPDAYVEEVVQLFYVDKGSSAESDSDDTIVNISLKNIAPQKISTTGNKKVRVLQAEKSNRYNLLQTLAELFEGWIRFDVRYLDNGKILRDENGRQKKRIQFKEIVGENNWNGFHYGTNLTSIERQINSDEIVSKIFVEQTESKNSASGIVSIQDSVYNKMGEIFLYNFDYYVRIGEISQQQLLNDLYGTSSTDLGFITKMQSKNREYKEISEKRNGLSNSISKLETEREGTIYRIQSAKDNAQSLADELPEGEYYNGQYYKVESPGFIHKERPLPPESQKENKDSIGRWASTVDNLYTYLKTLNDQLGYLELEDGKINDVIYTSELEKEKYVSTTKGYLKQLKDIDSDLDEISNTKKGYVEDFEEKYMRYITEGTWKDDNYTDADQYYLDAEKVLTTSAMPTVSYTIGVLALQALNGYEGYFFNVGDKTFVTDEDFFGLDDHNALYKQEVVISEMNDVLDSQNESTITVQNFRTQFEDLFSRITATVQTVQLKDQLYSRSENFTPNGEILVSTLQNTLLNNSLTLSQAVDQSVIINDRGIEVTDIFNPDKKLRIIADGVYVSSDGGLNWTAGFTASGINANFIVGGQLDINKIRIMNGSFPSFVWDKLGISAYQTYVDNSSSSDSPDDIVDGGGFVRFDQHGLYIAPTSEIAKLFGYNENGVAWYADPDKVGERVTWFDRLNYVQRNSPVSLTWRGLTIKSDTGSVEIGTELPAIRIFDNNEEGSFEDPYDNNYCRVELGFKDDGPGGITQRGDWDPVGKEGNEELYGLILRNDKGDQVLTTLQNGSLWLRENLFIGGLGSGELNSSIGIQAEGRTIDANGVLETAQVTEEDLEVGKIYLLLKEDTNDSFLEYELISINTSPIPEEETTYTLRQIIDPSIEVTIPIERILKRNPNKIFWSKTKSDFEEQGITDWYDTFTIDKEGNINANSIEIIGDSMFSGNLTATEGYFENIIGLGTVSGDGVYDSGFSASPLEQYEYRLIVNDDFLLVGDTIYTRTAVPDSENPEIIIDYEYTAHTLIKADLENGEFSYESDQEGNPIIVENPYSTLFLRSRIADDKDPDYAIWVKRLDIDNETGFVTGIKETPNFYVTHSGQLYGKDAIIEGFVTMTEGEINGVLTVGDSIVIDGETSSISVTNELETGEQRIFSVDRNADVIADSIKIGKFAEIKDYLLFGENFALSNPNMGNRDNTVIIAGDYDIGILKEGFDQSVLDEGSIPLETYLSNKGGRTNLRITSTGDVIASNLNITEGNSMISGSLKIFSDDEDFAITISAQDGIFTSTKEGEVTTGWRIWKNGTAEFQDIRARGEISTTIMKYNEVQVSSGNLLIRPASKILKIFKGIFKDEENNLKPYYGVALTEMNIGLSAGNRIMLQISSSTGTNLYSIVSEVFLADQSYPVMGENISSVIAYENSEEIGAIYHAFIEFYADGIDDETLSKFEATLREVDSRAKYELAKYDVELYAGREIFLLENGIYNSYYLTGNKEQQGESGTEEGITVFEYMNSDGIVQGATQISNIYLQYQQSYSDFILINLGSEGDGGISLNSTANSNFGSELTIDIFQYEKNNAGELEKKDRVVLGRLDGIRDSSFSDILTSDALSGFGLYSENAFIKGTITTGKAGLTTTLVNDVLIWAGGNPKNAPDIGETYNGKGIGKIINPSQIENLDERFAKIYESSEAFPLTITSSNRLLGDVNGDGEVTAIDSSLVSNHINGSETITDPIALLSADANRNGTIDDEDPTLILEMSVDAIELSRLFWPNNENKNFQNAKYYTEIELNGISETDDILIVSDNEIDLSIFVGVESLNDKIRIYSTDYPTVDIPIKVYYAPNISTYSEEQRIQAEVDRLGEGISNLPTFYVKENGFLFSRGGYFAGTIRSTDAEISGTIGTGGLKITDSNKGLFIAHDVEVQNEETGETSSEEQVTAVFNSNGLQLYSGSDLEIYEQSVLSKDLPPLGINPYIYSDDTFKGLILHKMLVTEIPNTNSIDSTIDQGIVFEQNGITFKQLNNIVQGVNKKERVNNLYINGQNKARISYNLEEQTADRTTGDNIQVDINGSVPLRIYERTVNVENLDVNGFVSFEELAIGRAILRKAGDKGLDIFVT